MKSKLTPRKLNKSLDERLLQPDHLIDALNVAIRTSPDGQAGVVKNVEANYPSEFIGADNDFFTGTNVVIGSVSDDSVGVVYLFVYNSESNHSIWAYSTETKRYRLIFTDPLLNFKPNGFVSADFVKIKRAVEDIGLPDSNYNTSTDDAIQPDVFEDFGEDVNVPGCTNPAAYNYNPDATQDDGSCVLPELLTVRFAMGIDFSTLANHIYGPTSGSDNFATAFTSSASFNTELSNAQGAGLFNAIPGADPFFNSDPRGVLIDAIDSITCQVLFLDSNGNPVTYETAENEIQIAAPFSVSDVNRRDLGYQFLSEDSILVEKQILVATKKVKAKLKVTFSDDFCNKLDGLYSLFYSGSNNTSWLPDGNQSLPSLQFARTEFEWLVPLYDSSETINNTSNLHAFLEEGETQGARDVDPSLAFNYVLTNAVGFKESGGIKAGSRANKQCLTSSMNGGELIFDQGDALAFDNFIDNPILLFPGFGFGCDTPHVQVTWRSESVNAGKRKIPIQLDIDFTGTEDWQNFYDHFTEIIDDDNADYDTGPDVNLGDRRSVVDLTEGGIYIFACSNYNDSIYDTFNGIYGSYGSISNMAADIGGDNYILYVSPTGAPPADFDQSVLEFGTSDFSQNGTQLGNPNADGPLNNASNFYYFPRRDENFSTNISNAYKPNRVFGSVEATSLGYQTKPLADSDVTFNDFTNYGLIGTQSPPETYILARLQAEGKYSLNINNAFVSGFGTLSVFNAFAFSTRALPSNPNQWPAFYEFDSPKAPENVPLGANVSSVLISRYSNKIYGYQSHGVGSGNDATYSDTVENVVEAGGDTDFLFRLFSIGPIFFINAAGVAEDINTRIRFQPGISTGNFLPGIANPTTGERLTIDGVLPEVTSPGDISLGTDSDSTDGEGTTDGGTTDGEGTTDGGTTTTTTTRTTRDSSATLASTPSKTTSSTQKRATTKYGY